MRKKNHQKKNATAGKAPRKQEITKVEKAIRKEELGIILQIQNLINEDIIKTNSSNSTDRNPSGTITASNFNCGSDESDIEKSASNSIIDFGLSEFVTLSSSDSDSDEDINYDVMEIDTLYVNSESVIELKDIQIYEKSIYLDTTEQSNILNDKINDSTSNSSKNDTKEDVADMLNKPLLSLCNTAKVTKPTAQNQSVKTKLYECPSCNSKFRKIWNFERHMKNKHPDHKPTITNEKENTIPSDTLNVQPILNHSQLEANMKTSIKSAMSNIIKDRIMKLLKADNDILGSHCSLYEKDSYNFVAEKLVEKIVTVSDERFNHEMSKTSQGTNNDFLSDFEL